MSTTSFNVTHLASIVSSDSRVNQTIHWQETNHRSRSLSGR